MDIVFCLSNAICSRGDQPCDTIGPEMRPRLTSCVCVCVCLSCPLTRHVFSLAWMTDKLTMAPASRGEHRTVWSGFTQSSINAPFREHYWTSLKRLHFKHPNVISSNVIFVLIRQESRLNMIFHWISRDEFMQKLCHPVLEKHLSIPGGEINEYSWVEFRRRHVTYNHQKSGSWKLWQNPKSVFCFNCHPQSPWTPRSFLYWTNESR